MIEEIIKKDQEFLVFLNNLGSEQWDGFWMFMTSKYTTIPIYVLLIVLFAKNFGWKKTIFFVLFGVLLIAMSDQLANLFKYGFERLRPCHQSGVQDVIRIVKKSCGGKFSYFSAHASTGMALATYFGLALKSVSNKLRYVLFVLALFVGYSRIYIGVHYPLDVFTGFIIGGVLAIIVYKFLGVLFKKWNWFKS